MNTKTTNKWLKLLAVAAMLTVNASGAWAVCEAEFIKFSALDGDKKDINEARKATASDISGLASRNDKETLKTYIADEEKSMKVKDRPPKDVATSQLVICYLRAAIKTAPDKISSNANEEPNANELPEPTGKCKAALDKFLLDFEVVNEKPLPQEGGADAIEVRDYMRQMWIGSEQLKIWKNICPQNNALTKFNLERWPDIYRNAETSCKERAIKLKPPIKCVPNAFR